MSENVILSYGPSVLNVNCRIKQFFELSSGSYLESPDFSVFGAKGRLQIYPQYARNNISYVGLFLAIRNISDSNFTVDYKLAIKKTDGSDLVSREAKHNFTVEEATWGWYQFIEKSTLLNAKDIVAPDGSLIVFCSIYNKNFSGDMPDCVHIDGEEILSENLKDLYVNGNFSDVTIVVKGKELPAHRNVLAARSKVFESMFKLDMVEKMTGKVEIKDCDPVSFDKFLLFLYSGKLEDLSWSDAVNVYSLGEKYDVPSVKRKCVRYLINTLSVNSIYDAISFATFYNEDKLMTAAKKFFSANIKAILSDTKWKEFIVEHPSLGTELFSNYVKNNEI